MSVYVFGHKSPDTDSVAAAIAFAALKKAQGEDYVPVMQGKPNPETEMVLRHFGISAPQEMTDAAGKQIALVDHNDLAQAPDNFAQAELLAVVDHHKIGDVTTNSPIFFCAMPVGCSCTVLTNLYERAGVRIDPKVAGMMLAAILSDTVNFKSPTCTEDDKKAVATLKEIAGVKDTDALFMEMLKAKSAVAGVPPMDLLHRDYKDFDMNGKKVGIDVKIKPVDYNLLDKIGISGEYDLLISNITTANTGDPEIYLNWYWRTNVNGDNPQNGSGYSNPEYDAKCAELAVEFDPAKRRQIMIDMQQILLNDAAGLFLGYPETNIISSTKITGAIMHPADYYWITNKIKPAN